MFFESLSSAPHDPIMALSSLCLQDTRSQKLDLGIGVYRNALGQTPVFDAVKAAEQSLVAAQDSKAYVGMQGHLGFNRAMTSLLLGEQWETSRVRTLQTPGASGALRLLADLIARTNADATIWLSDPSYTNHEPIFRAAGLAVRYYPYFDLATKQVNSDAMIAQLSQLGTNDVVVLHGCCHNPTGADMSLELWQQVTELSLKTGFLPFIDMAYQGFGRSLEEDAQGTRYLTARVPSFLLASSCSKNFGLYRERVGVAMMAGHSEKASDSMLSQLLSLARNSYTMPPDHGAAIVAAILSYESLKASWQEELSHMTQHIQNTRKQLRQALEHRFNRDYSFIEQHQGMFSMLGIDADSVHRLRIQKAIYLLDNGRLNIAGLAPSQIEYFADSLFAVERMQ
ncbi:amino acid aminotransferase [Marinomonas communis]|uniref:amino acid aminotransferase n=1 Tax=Marinomonas communis TaxID=28254 RepID=UPI001D190FED|nr:amino acid aminotransferase [Marinomonas communis]MCC4274019.1 aspartate/tyrosine/aromatic aminotransferase [Marinomonas communis]